MLCTFALRPAYSSPPHLSLSHSHSTSSCSTQQNWNDDGDNFSKKWLRDGKFSRWLQNLSLLFQAVGILCFIICFALHFFSSFFEVPFTYFQMLALQKMISLMFWNKSESRKLCLGVPGEWEDLKHDIFEI